MDVGGPSSADVGRPSSADVGRPSSTDVGRPSSTDKGRPSSADVGRPSSMDMARPSSADSWRWLQSEFEPTTRPGGISSGCIGEVGPKQTHGGGRVGFGLVWHLGALARPIEDFIV
eukprot:g37833.t1